MTREERDAKLAALDAESDALIERTRTDKDTDPCYFDLTPEGWKELGRLDVAWVDVYDSPTTD